MTATITPIRRTRTGNPARWQKALARAFDQGVAVRQLACGVWVATSGTDTAAAYAVSLFDCECRAAQEGDPVCKHRAMLAYSLGHLEPEPEPPAPAAVPANVVPFPSPAERERRRNAATADKAVALIERLAARDGDALWDLPLAA